MSDHQDQTPTGSAGTTAAPPPRGWLSTTIACAAIAIVASGATMATAPKWSPPVFRIIGIPDPVSGPLRRVSEDNARLTKALETLEARTAAATEQIGRIAGAAEGGAAAAADLRSATLALAVAELRSALRRQGPFDIEIATVRAIAGKDPEVDAALAGFADRARDGLPYRGRLREQFHRVADAALAASEGTGDGGAMEAAWYAPIAAVVAHFRYLTELDTLPPDSPYEVVKRARTRVAADDLAGAAGELATLNGPAAEAAKDWITAVQARTAADRGIATLTTLTQARMGAKPTP